MPAVRDPEAEKSPLKFAKDCAKTVFTLMHVFSRTKKAPPFCFSFFLAMWGVWWADTLGYLSSSHEWALNPRELLMATSSSSSSAAGTGAGGRAEPAAEVNLNTTKLYNAAVLHWLVPYCGFLRTCVIGSLLLIYGYTYELMIGTNTFLTRFLTAHAALVALQCYFSPDLQIFGIEPTLTTIQCMVHFSNPKIAASSIRDEFLKTDQFQVEPRWHGWLLLFLLVFSTQWPVRVGVFALGLACGTLYVVRYPSTWPHLRSFYASDRRFFAFVVLFLASLIYLPVTSRELPDPAQAVSNPLSLINATLRRPELSYLSLASYVEPMPEAYFLLQIAIALTPIAILLVAWGAREKAFACFKPTYGVMSLLLAMYVMNTQSWAYANTGFVGLLYASYGFFTC